MEELELKSFALQHFLILFIAYETPKTFSGASKSLGDRSRAVSIVEDIERSTVIRLRKPAASVVEMSVFLSLP